MVYVDVVYRGEQRLVIYTDVWEADRSPSPQYFRWLNIKEKVRMWGNWIKIPRSLQF